MNKIIKQAFTLIELLVVIAIIGILSGLIIVSMSGITQKANIAKIQIFSNSLRNSLLLSLVSEWKFDQILGSSAPYTTPDSWNGGNTGTLTDTSGACSFTGTLKCPQLVTSGCPSGNCLSFDGTDDSVTVGSGTSLQNQDLTIEFWANPSAIESGTTGIIGTTGYTSNLGFGLYANSNNLYIVWAGNGSALQYVYDVFIIATGWNHYIVTKSGATLNAYKNGVITKTGTNLTNSISYTGTSWYIGQSISTSFNFYGLIDEVRMYNSAISTSQIKEQYYAGLNKLFANGVINQGEYLSKINSLAAK